MMSPERTGPAEDPFALDRDRAANACEQIAAQEATAARLLRESPFAGPFLEKFAERLSLRADADLEQARLLRGGRPEPSRRSGRVHLRVVR